LGSLEKEWTPLNPKFEGADSAKRVFLETARCLAEIQDRDEVAPVRATALQGAERCGEQNQLLRVCISVLCDLKVQGWGFRVEGSKVFGRPPESETDSSVLEKQRIREAHLFERDSQLRLPAAREFIRSMERRRLGPTGWVSILSLMRDGPELASRLRSVLTQKESLTDAAALPSCIDPYIQFVDPNSRCEFTGLKLSDIWRYFRHTWVIPYYSVPGRQICMLIRDRAAERHPVIGIAALGSSVVQLTPRDSWIGWTPKVFIRNVKNKATDKWAFWVRDSLRSLLNAIHVRDLIEEKVVSRSDLRRPTPKVIERLMREAKDARHWHTRYPKASEHKKVTQNWEKEARTYLFRAKRAKALAELLLAKLRLSEAGFTSPDRKCLSRVLESSGGRRAIEVILKHVKAVHIGIDMLDITVCGAIPPYNSILGGKLVALLLASPEVAVAYEKRYATSASIIASSMAGRAVLRKPKLVLLGTTSLYGVSSSQYNRLKMSAEVVGGKPGHKVSYELIGRSLGYGSYHLSATTVDEIELLLAQSEGGRRVNSIFGEGVNPRLRKVRDGLDLVGLPADRVLRHGNPRIVYGVALASNFREVLLGISEHPSYLLPRSNVRRRTRSIADFWTHRWLSMRIQREGVLKDVEAHSLNYPLQHGARVVLPPADDEEALFSVASQSAYPAQSP